MPELQIVDTSEVPGRRGKWTDTLEQVRAQLPLLPGGKSIRLVFNSQEEATQCRMAWGHYKIRNSIPAKCVQDNDEPWVLWFTAKENK